MELLYQVSWRSRGSSGRIGPPQPNEPLDILDALLGMKADAVKIRVLVRPDPAKHVMKITLSFGDPLLRLSLHAKHALCA